MKVYQLSDNLTVLSHSGFADEEIVAVINGTEYEIKSAINQDGEMKLIVGDALGNPGYFNELM